MVMDTTIGVNLRVTAHSSQGGRKYMEDMLCVAYQPTSDEKDLLYAFFGIFDGHGGREAAAYTKEHLMDNIVCQKNFWAEDDESILKAIHDGFVNTHYAMRKELDHWPKTASGLPSTSGTTASVAFVRRSKLYIGHVGDSALILGYQDPQSGYWRAKTLTTEHKPESMDEKTRITQCGGKVIRKSGVPRVVWNRPRLGHKGPVRRSTPIDEIPFLAVARSLGDFWSYNSNQNEFVVSPEPDVSVVDIDISSFRCLIFASDGLWNMLNAQEAVNSVYFAEKNNERQLVACPPETVSSQVKNWINPSKRLVDRALDRWYHHNLRADNTSVVTVVIDPPGPPKSQVVRATYKNFMSQRAASSQAASTTSTIVSASASTEVVVEFPKTKGKATKGKGSDGRNLRFACGTSFEASALRRPLPHAKTTKGPREMEVPTLVKSTSSASAGGQHLVSSRRLTSPPVLALKPPVVMSSVRTVPPDRPVWTQRKRERGLDIPQPPAASPSITAPRISSEKKERHASGSTGIKQSSGVGSPNPESSAKRRKTGEENPLSHQFATAQTAETETIPPTFQINPPTQHLSNSAVQINEISSSSELDGNSGKGARGRDGKVGCQKRRFQNRAVTDTDKGIGRRTRQTASSFTPVIIRLTRNTYLRDQRTIGRRKTSLKMTSTCSIISQQKSETIRGAKNLDFQHESPRFHIPTTKDSAPAKGKGVPLHKEVEKTKQGTEVKVKKVGGGDAGTGRNLRSKDKPHPRVTRSQTSVGKPRTTPSVR